MISEADILKARILIVDDQAANVAVLEQMLNGAGYSAVSATREPIEVCALHQKHHYDLILLDLQMPGMDGFQVLEGLKAIEPDGHLAVLVVTAQPGHKLRALKAGANDFVSKPFDLGEVLMRVHNLLEVRLLHRSEHLLALARLENSQRIAGLGDWEYDFDRQRLVWSAEVYRILGFSRDEFPPDSELFYRQVHPDDLAFVQREKQAAAAGLRRAEFEHRIIRPDGEVRHIHQIAEIIFNAEGRAVRESGTIRDTTERKLADETLRQSDQRFRKLIMVSPDAHFVHVDGIITLVNPAFCRLMGATEPEQLLGRVALDVVHPDDRLRVQHQRLTKLEQASLPLSEIKLIRLDGSAVTVEAASVGFDFQGRMEVQVSARDVSARKRAEEELREKTALLEAQIHSSLDGLLIVDPQGKRILQNNRYLDLMKIPRDIVELADDIVTRDHVMSMMRHPTAVLAKVKYLYLHPGEASWDELELTNGTVLDRYSTPIIGKDGRNYGRIWAFRDATANKAAERALRESEERFKFVVRAVSAAVWDWDPRVNSVWWNEAFLATFGFKAADTTAGFEFWMSRIHPDERGRVRESLHRAIEGSAESWSEEYRFQREDGSHAFVQDNGYILRDPAGKGVRMVGGMRDVSERKRLDEHFLQAQKMEALGQFSGGVAHDFNNILATIFGYAELSQMLLKNNPEISEHLAAILQASNRAADLVKQILTFSRQQPLVRRAINLQPVVAESIKLMRATTPSTVELEIALATDAPTVLANANQIHQVMMNLSINAWHAMKDRPGRLQVKLERCVVDAAHAATQPRLRPGLYARISVSDTGAGMDAATMKRIFEPFFTTKPPGEGTGLGLAVVHGIMDGHDGVVTVYSHPNEGTVFHLYFPAHAGEAATPDSTDGPTPLGQHQKILVVDDEDLLARLGQKTLLALGYEAEFTTQPAAALAMVRADPQRFSLLLTDLTMPGMTGLTLANEIRQIQPAMPVILMTGYSLALTTERIEAAGIHQLLVKPISIHSLAMAVKSALLPQPPSQ